MSKSAWTDWEPEQDLAILLDALTDELLAMPDREVAAWLRDVGEEAQDAVREVGRLVEAADGVLLVPPVSGYVGHCLRAHATRNQ
jgi:hypothetical protein